MSEIFEIGDVCIGQNHIFDIANNGMECVIIGHLAMRESWHEIEGDEDSMTYQVKWADGEYCRVKPFNLRRKPSALKNNTAQRLMGLLVTI